MAPSANAPCRTMSRTRPPGRITAGTEQPCGFARGLARGGHRAQLADRRPGPDFFGFCQLIAFSALVAAPDFRLGTRHGRMGVKSKPQYKSVYRPAAWLAAPLAAVLAVAGAPAVAKTAS